MTFPSLIPGKLKRVLARHRSTAARGERLVARYLRRNGYRVLATNLRVGRGEIDIVAETPDRRAIAIVEVKSCDRSHASRPPEMRVGRNKQRQLTVLVALREREVRRFLGRVGHCLRLFSTMRRNVSKGASRPVQRRNWAAAWRTNISTPEMVKHPAARASRSRRVWIGL